MTSAVANQLAAAYVSHLHGDVERPEDMPTSCEGCGNCCGMQKARKCYVSAMNWIHWKISARCWIGRSIRMHPR